MTAILFQLRSENSSVDDDASNFVDSLLDKYVLIGVMVYIVLIKIVPVITLLIWNLFLRSMGTNTFTYMTE